jgi:hypothetical protein
MKQPYAKPVLLRRGLLSPITAGGGGGQRAEISLGRRFGTSARR